MGYTCVKDTLRDQEFKLICLQTAAAHVLDMDYIFKDGLAHI